MTLPLNDPKTKFPQKIHPKQFPPAGVCRWEHMQKLMKKLGLTFHDRETYKAQILNLGKDSTSLPTFLRLWRIDRWANRPMKTYTYANYVDTLTSNWKIWEPPDPCWPKHIAEAWVYFHQWLVMVWPDDLKLPYIPDVRWRCLIRAEKAVRYYRQQQLHSPTAIAEYVLNLTRILMEVDPDSRFTRFDLYRAVHAYSDSDDQRKRAVRNYVPSGIEALHRMCIVGNIFEGVKDPQAEYTQMCAHETPEDVDIEGHVLYKVADVKHLMTIGPEEWEKWLQNHGHFRASALVGMVQPVLNRLRNTEILSQEAIVADIDKFVTNPYTDEPGNIYSVDCNKGDHFSVMREYLNWCMFKGWIACNPLGDNPWAAHVRAYPGVSMISLDSWYKRTHKTAGFQGKRWSWFREDLSCALWTYTLRGCSTHAEIEAILREMPAKSMSGETALTEERNRNAAWTIAAAKAILDDPVGLDKKILYKHFPHAAAAARAGMSVDVSVIEDEKEMKHPVVTKTLCEDIDFDLSGVEAVKWDEDKPKGLSTDVDTTKGVNPLKTTQTDTGETAREKLARIAPLMGIDPDNPPENDIRKKNAQTIDEVVASMLEDTQPENEVKALVGEGKANGSWKNELAGLFTDQLDLAAVEAMTNKLVTLSSLNTPVTNGDLGTAAFLRHCNHVGGVELTQFCGSKLFRKLLNSAVKESKKMTSSPVFFADAMALDHRHVEYDSEIDRFLHLCYRLGSEW